MADINKTPQEVTQILLDSEVGGADWTSIQSLANANTLATPITITSAAQKLKECLAGLFQRQQKVIKKGEYTLGSNANAISGYGRWYSTKVFLGYFDIPLEIDATSVSISDDASIAIYTPPATKTSGNIGDLFDSSKSISIMKYENKCYMNFTSTTNVGTANAPITFVITSGTLTIS